MLYILISILFIYAKGDLSETSKIICQAKGSYCSDGFFLDNETTVELNETNKCHEVIISNQFVLEEDCFLSISNETTFFVDNNNELQFFNMMNDSFVVNFDIQSNSSIFLNGFHDLRSVEISKNSENTTLTFNNSFVIDYDFEWHHNTSLKIFGDIILENATLDIKNALFFVTGTMGVKNGTLTSNEFSEIVIFNIEVGQNGVVMLAHPLHDLGNATIKCNGILIIQSKDSSLEEYYSLSLYKSFLIKDDGGLFIYGIGGTFGLNMVYCIIEGNGYMYVNDFSFYLTRMISFVAEGNSKIVWVNSQAQIVELNIVDNSTLIFNETVAMIHFVRVEGTSKIRMFGISVVHRCVQVVFCDDSTINLYDEGCLSSQSLTLTNNTHFSLFNNSKANAQYLKAGDMSLIEFGGNGFITMDYSACTVSTEDDCIKMFITSQCTIKINNDFYSSKVFHIKSVMIYFSSQTTIEVQTKNCIVFFLFESTYEQIYFIKHENFFIDSERVISYCNENDRNITTCQLIKNCWNNVVGITSCPFPFGTLNCPCDGKYCLIKSMVNYLIIRDFAMDITLSGNTTDIYFDSDTQMVQKISGTVGAVFLNGGISIQYKCSSAPIVTVHNYHNTKDINVLYSLECGDSEVSKITTFVIDNQIIQIQSTIFVQLYFRNEIKVFHVSSSGMLSVSLSALNGFRIGEEQNICSFAEVLNGILTCIAYKEPICYGLYIKNQSNSECVQCFDGLFCDACVEMGKCSFCSQSRFIEKDGVCVFGLTGGCIKTNNGRCVYCQNGFIRNGSCSTCEDSCSNCYEDECLVCSLENHTISDNYQCRSAEHTTYSSAKTVLMCENKYFNENNSCISCSSKYVNCEECEIGRCLKCKAGLYLNQNGGCGINNCLVENEGFCIECEDDFVLDERKFCAEKVNGCLNYVNNRCVECEDTLFLSNGTCFTTSESLENCLDVEWGKCVRCEDGWYLNKNNVCTKCNEECKTCYLDGNKCLTCFENRFLSNSKCAQSESLKNICERYSFNGGCTKCVIGYYMNNFDCVKCNQECESCINSKSCLVCNKTNFMNEQNQCEPQSNIIGCAVEISQKGGCTKCLDGYYVSSKKCMSCPEHCSLCSNGQSCESCENNYVLDVFRCVSKEVINNCLEVVNSKCSKCSFFFKPNESGTYCEKEVPIWFVCVLSICLMFIVAITVVVVAFGANGIASCLMKNENITYSTFSIKRGGIKFSYELVKNVYCDVETLKFTGETTIEIPVGENTSCDLCIGNKGKSPIRIQFVFSRKKIKNPRLEMEFEPPVVYLPDGKAIKVKCTVKPLCWCEIQDNFKVVVVKLRKNNKLIGTIGVEAETAISTRLHPDEVIHGEEKIGEGTFGVVFKGVFRGNTVAVKKLKLSRDTNVDDFEKEVAMLNKFRSEHIVYFYGAVISTEKMWLITEYAPFGSLLDLINSVPSDNLSKTIKIRFMLDASKGIEYLHSNGILHRDIKSDNLLIFSIKTTEKINCKLTDFGSARNLNQMMTNMTFTRGIGTPAYMSPEALVMDKYSKPSDIYSFAITMYECFKWKCPYEDDQFARCWEITQFILDGKRLPKLPSIPSDAFNLIQKCWQQNPKERLSSRQVVEELTLLCGLY